MKTENQPQAAPSSERLVSLDALRGFDMIWIVGADAVGYGLSHFRGGWIARTLADQFEHVPWEGFHFYDLIFPLFIFMIGVAITFSLNRLQATEGRSAALRRIGRRALLMYALGLFYYGGFANPLFDISPLRPVPRLPLCYFFSTLLSPFF